jgi:hypothetical protein
VTVADINQPGNGDVQCEIIPDDIVADLAQFQPISFSADNTIDAAVATIRDGQVRPDGAILDIGLPASTPVEASIGMAVKKSGRTTGLTRGTIAAIAVTVKVVIPTECGLRGLHLARFVNQLRIRGNPLSHRFAKSGDSGALIVEDQESCPRPVGLLFAGSLLNVFAFANPIKDVLSGLGVSIVGCPVPTAGAQDLTEEPRLHAGEVATAMGVQRRHTDWLMAMPGVVGTGIGRSARTGRWVIEVYLEEGTPEMRQALPPVLEGVELAPVVTGKIFALGCPTSAAELP